MRLKFLQARHHNLGQVALLVAIGDLDRFVQFPFTQRTGDCRSELPRLLLGGVICQQAIDHHTNRPGRHNEQNQDYQLCQSPHLVPKRTDIPPGLFCGLQQPESPNLQL